MAEILLNSENEKGQENYTHSVYDCVSSTVENYLPWTGEQSKMEEVLKDKRFAHIAKDPRYRRIPRGERKVKIDKRFKSMFKDKQFKLKYSVDKRGRPVNLTSNENLKKYYELSDEENSSESEDSDAEDNESDDDHGERAAKDDQNTDDAKDSPDSDGEHSEEEEVQKEVATLKDKLADERKKSETKKQKIKKNKQKDPEDSDSSDSLPNRDDSGVDFARGEGNIESSSSEEDDDDDDDDNEEKGAGSKGHFDHKWGEVDHEVERVSEATRRLAMCNMDWDRVSAKDVFMLLHSFKPTNGVIHSVKIYPSEFGKQRMEEENAYGPKELRETKLESDEEEGTVEDSEGTSYHIEKLRQYQLNRLKYYYAVVECDTKETANAIYEECDGMEYETSATRLDLRFIPDDMEFDDTAKSECTEQPGEYTPNLFTNTALSQSKVDLTWDETDRTRVQLTSKQFTSKNKDVDDADLQAYLAGSSDEEGFDYGKLVDVSDQESESEDEEKQIEKYKKLLQGIDETEDRKKEKDVQMEITWEPGLREATEGIIKQKQTKALGPWEEYLQKKKEKKERRKEERRRKKHEGGERKLEQQSSDSDDQDDDMINGEQAFSDDELPADFDQSDPFFIRDDDDDSKTKKKIKEKKKKKKGKEAIVDDGEAEQEKAELSLLMMDEDREHKKHFRLDKLIDDSSGKKKKKKRLEKQKANKDDDDFQMQLDDPRFSAVYSSHLYNIDPSAPEFRKTKGTEALIQEKLKRSETVSNKKHKLSDSGDSIKHKKRKNDGEVSTKLTEKMIESKATNGNPVDDSLDSLIKSVKAKTQQFHTKKKR